MHYCPLYQVRTLHQKTEESITILTVELEHNKAQMAMLETERDSLRSSTNTKEEQERELAWLRTVVEANKQELERLQPLEQTAREQSVKLSTLEAAHAQQKEGLETWQRQALAAEQREKQQSSELQDTAQKLASAQGLLETKEATEVAMRDQVERLTEILQAERRVGSTPGSCTSEACW